jgi:signal recognition particle receptor subunit beta
MPSGRHSPSLPSGSKKQSAVAVKSTKRGKKNYLLICGPTNSGKTGLFYHLVTKQVRMTVSSTEENQSNGLMEVKIPGTTGGEAVTKKMNIIDIPGHYHFKEKLNQTLDDAKAIILMVDSKEKQDLSE